MALAALSSAQTGQQQMQIIVLMASPDQLASKVRLVIQGCPLLGPRVIKEGEVGVDYEGTGVPEAYKEYR